MRDLEIFRCVLQRLEDRAAEIALLLQQHGGRADGAELVLMA